MLIIHYSIFIHIQIDKMVHALGLILGENTTLKNSSRLDEVGLCSQPPASGSYCITISALTFVFAISASLKSKFGII